MFNGTPTQKLSGYESEHICYLIIFLFVGNVTVPHMYVYMYIYVENNHGCYIALKFTIYMTINRTHSYDHESLSINIDIDRHYSIHTLLC